MWKVPVVKAMAEAKPSALRCVLPVRLFSQLQAEASSLSEPFPGGIRRIVCEKAKAPRPKASVGQKGTESFRRYPQLVFIVSDAKFFGATWKVRIANPPIPEEVEGEWAEENEAAYAVLLGKPPPQLRRFTEPDETRKAKTEQTTSINLYDDPEKRPIQNYAFYDQLNRQGSFFGEAKTSGCNLASSGDFLRIGFTSGP